MKWTPKISAVGALLGAGLLLGAGPELKPLRLIQVIPNTDTAAVPRAIVERVVDPNSTDRNVVNVNIELKNERGDDVSLSSVRFDYTRSGSALLAQTVQAADVGEVLLTSTPEGPTTWTRGRPTSMISSSSWGSFLGDWQAEEARGMRMFDYETFLTGNVRTYTGLLSQTSEGRSAHIGLPWSDFLSRWQQAEAQGLRLVDLEIEEGNPVRFSGIFHAASYAPRAHFNATFSAFQSAWADAEKSGYRLIDFETYLEGGTRKYAGIFAPGSYAAASCMGVTWSTFLSKWQELEAQDFGLEDVEIHTEGSQVLYSGLFRKGGPRGGAWMNATLSDFEAHRQAFEAQGLELFELETHLSLSGTRLYSGLFRAAQPLRWKKDASLHFFSPQAGFANTIPDRVRVTFDLAGISPKPYFDLPLAPYQNQTSTGTMAFPARQSELPSGRFWSQGGNAHAGPRTDRDPPELAHIHRAALWGASGARWAGQQYAYDLGVSAWDNGAYRACASDCTKNSDFYIWGIPVRAMADGKVAWCWRDADDNPNPGTIVSTPAPGGNMLWIRHAGNEYALYAHLQKESIPKTLCPTNGLQTAGASVSRGTLLGKAGNSGQSSGPHLHLHVQQGWEEGTDKGMAVPILFDNIDVRALSAGQSATWINVPNAGVAAHSLIRID